MTRIVVIGGGFSGAMVAVHLKRDHPGLAARVTVVDDRETLGAGLAYGTPDPACRTNVAASRMSPFEEAPDAFDDWLSAIGAVAADPAMVGPGGRFPSRAVFGRYVASEAARHAVAHRRARAVAACRSDGEFSVDLDDGGRLAADMLVLATGHPRPGLPAVLRTIAHDPRLVRDPWDLGAIERIARAPDCRVLLVGTGLTSCDVVASLRRRGHREPIVAVSRRGLLPRERTTRTVSSFGDFTAGPSRTARGLARRVRDAVAEAGRLDRPWEDVIAALREQAPVVWRSLPLAEQRRLLRHLRAFWDVHRFQSAPQVASLVAGEQAAGGLVVHAAAILDARADEDGLALACRIRGDRATLRLRSDVIVNCTGPGHASAVASSDVLASLHARGLVRPDPLGLGLETDVSNLAVGDDGLAVPRLWVAGPPARSAHGELMGLPQVSRQPREIARSIARCVRDGIGTREAVVERQTFR